MLYDLIATASYPAHPTIILDLAIPHAECLDLLAAVQRIIAQGVTIACVPTGLG